MHYFPWCVPWFWYFIACGGYHIYVKWKFYHAVFHDLVIFCWKCVACAMYCVCLLPNVPLLFQMFSVLPQPNSEGHVFILVGLPVSNITGIRIKGLPWNFHDMFDMEHLATFSGILFCEKLDCFTFLKSCMVEVYSLEVLLVLYLFIKNWSYGLQNQQLRHVFIAFKIKQTWGFHFTSL